MLFISGPISSFIIYLKVKCGCTGCICSVILFCSNTPNSITTKKRSNTFFVFLLLILIRLEKYEKMTKQIHVFFSKVPRKVWAVLGVYLFVFLQRNAKYQNTD